MAYNITEVRLLNVPLENDYTHTLYFENKTAQTNYFLSKTVKSGYDFTYQRKDKIIRYPLDYDSLVGCNYVMYKNSGTSSKWYYAFITKLEFVSNGRTDITIETDVLQTWLFDFTVKPSFVEREHVSDDTIGAHTLPEGLETGEYIVNSRNANESLLETTLIIGTTVNLNDADFKIYDTNEIVKFKSANGGIYNGVFSGVKYFAVPISEAKEIIKTLANTGQSDSIVSLFMCPKHFINTTTPSGDTKKYPEVVEGESCDKGGWVTGFVDNDEENYKPTNLNGYTPKNKKLLTYPFTYMLMSNNAGGSAIYRYELFNNPDNANICPFRIYSSITPAMSIRIVPLHYNGCARNNEEGLNLGKFPVCSWANDVYTNWLTQNAVNNSVSIISGLAMAGIGVASALSAPVTGGASLAVAGAIAGGGMSIGSAVGQIHQQSFTPPHASGNTNSGDVTYSAGYLTFTAHQMTIKKEYARIIDKYFDVFGYKVNMVKVPARNHRENYWYTKCIDVNIDGAIPMGDMKKIKACYNKGLTYWRTPANIQNYSVSNNIL